MKTTSILATVLLSILAAACSGEQSTQGPQAPASNTVVATSAVRMSGDLVPARLVAIALPRLAAEPTLSASMPGMPKRVFANQQVIDPSTRREFGRGITAVEAPTAGKITFPIDAPSGARVIVSSRNPNAGIPSAHLLDASGNRLDRARDANEEVLMVRRVPGVKPASPTSKEGKESGAAPPPAKAPESPPTRGSALRTEPGLAGLSMPSRILAIDVPGTKAGRVTLEIPAAALANGIDLYIQQPNSAITFTGAPKALNYGFGDVAEVEYSLSNGDQTIDGATITGSIALPNGERIPGLTFIAQGNGRYVVRVPIASADLKTIGVWHVYAKATGTANGVEFERDMDSGFAYSPAHARMTAVHTPQVVRGSDGLVDEISLDVDLETVVDDRLGIGATLVYKGADGVEHSIAVAQTSADIKAGRGTMTLHFESKDAVLARVSGPFLVRELFLMSHSFSVLQHRLGRGLDLTTPHLAASDLRMPKVFSPAVQEMFDLGVLERP